MITKIYSSFCGTGKSYLCNKNPHTYKEIECWKYSSNIDFPNNYVEEVIKHIDTVEYLFISTNPIILKELYKRSIEFTLIYPNKNLKGEYKQRFLNRNSPTDFIDMLMKNWNIWIEELESITYCKHIILEKNEYLSRYVS